MKNERNKQGITEVLYETDGQIYDFTAKVISCEPVNDENCGTSDKVRKALKKGAVYAVVLDKTAFFPEGGGQQADEGTINGQAVIDVQTDDGRILHYMCQSCEKDLVVKGKINERVRFSRMQNHTAEHILSGIIHKDYGYENVGFHMSDDEVVFDVNGILTSEQILNLERKANEAVYRNMQVVISYPDEEEAKNLEYRSKLDTYENIRLVTIGDIDICACCAPHVSTTGQIGIIKIIDYMPHRQGMRITMIAGIKALHDYEMLHENNSAIMAILSSKRENTAKYAQDFADKQKQLRDENTSIKYELVKIITEKITEGLKSRAVGDNSTEVIFTNTLDNLGLRNLINSCTQEFPYVFAGFIGDDREGYKYIISTSQDVDIRAMANKLNEKFNGRGGGNAQMVQGSIQGKRKDIEEYLKQN